MAQLRTLSLTNFRSYTSLYIDEFHPNFVAFIGENGVGKTNLLEAISLLSAGKGLRGAPLSDLICIDSNTSWGVSSKLSTPYGEITIGTGSDDDQSRRSVFIQGIKAKSQTALSEHIRAIWLTPQMDRLFIDPATTRRKFLDRLVFTYDEAHAGRIRRYENALSQRSKLLKESMKIGAQSNSWLDSLESQMAESSTAIAASRLDYIQKLQAEIDSSSNDHFPKARLELKGFVEEQSLKQPSLSIEDELKSLWRSSRIYDSEHGGSQYGVHRTDLDVYFVNKNREAHLSSTGEQKSLLIGIILAQARFIKRAHGTPPIILLDEIAAHLDDTRRQFLYQNLSDIGSQIFLTGTDRMLFDHLNNAQKFTIKEGGILSL